jgi:hypothetical protein
MAFRNRTNLVLLAASLLAAGCASIVSKSNWPVNVTSSPPECRVTLKDKRGIKILKGTIPTVITLPSSSGFFSGADYSLVFEKDGFEPVTVTLSSELNPWYIGNILFGGLIGFLVVDPATGPCSGCLSRCTVHWQQRIPVSSPTRRACGWEHWRRSPRSLGPNWKGYANPPDLTFYPL